MKPYYEHGGVTRETDVSELYRLRQLAALGLAAPAGARRRAGSKPAALWVRHDGRPAPGQLSLIEAPRG